MRFRISLFAFAIYQIYCFSYYPIYCTIYHTAPFSFAIFFAIFAIYFATLFAVPDCSNGSKGIGMKSFCPPLEFLQRIGYNNIKSGFSKSRLESSEVQLCL